VRRRSRQRREAAARGKGGGVRRGGIYGRARRRLRAAEQPGAVERGSGVRRDLAWAGAAAADTSALSWIDNREDKAQVATPTEVEPITIEYLRERYWERS
jgi:hypothetical protein